jgi:hypothetical protein
MVPVINLQLLRETVANRTPEQRKQSRIRSQELVKAALESIDCYKKLCEEQGIPYIPCVAAVQHPMAKYSR